MQAEPGRFVYAAVATTLLLILAQTPVSDAQPPQVNKKQVAALFQREAFEELERIVAPLRSGNYRSPNGEFELNKFYGSLHKDFESMDSDQESAFNATIERWEQAYPDSVTWRILLGRALVEFGWRERGSGLAYTVTDEGWKEFEKYLHEAWQVLSDARGISKDDPELFVIMSIAARGLGSELQPTALDLLRRRLITPTGADDIIPPDFSVSDVVLRDAMQHAKYYAPFYQMHIITVLPRWGGEHGDPERLAARIADNTADQAGDEFYARMAHVVLEYADWADYQRDFSFSWPRIKKGMEALIARHPRSNLWKNQFCLMAYMHEDKATAASLIDQLNPPIYSTRVWAGKISYRTFRLWAQEGHPYPRGAYIMYATVGEDLEELERLLNVGADPDSINFYGSPALVEAAKKNLVEYAKVLLEAGGNPDVRSGSRYTPILGAIQQESPAMLELLLAHGADPNFIGQENWSALVAAASDGKLEHATTLMAVGADIAHKIDEGFTALHVAAQNGHLEMVKYLLEHGADIHATLDTGETPRQLAVEEGFTETADYLRAVESRR